MQVVPGAMACVLAREFISEPVALLSCWGWLLNAVAMLTAILIVVIHLRAIRRGSPGSRSMWCLADVILVGIAVGMHVGGYLAR